MTYEEFLKSLSESNPAAVLTDALQSLWWDAKGNWSKAHDIAQEIKSSEGSWIHAYLHRKEGDLSNAEYWYSRAGRSSSCIPLEKEWEEILRAVLKNEG